MNKYSLPDLSAIPVPYIRRNIKRFLPEIFSCCNLNFYFCNLQKRQKNFRSVKLKYDSQSQEVPNILLQNTFSTRLSISPVKTVKMSIEISDDGTGIDNDIVKQAFDPFFTTKPAGKGTGLGLAVCYGIITAHGGRIE